MQRSWGRDAVGKLEKQLDLRAECVSVRGDAWKMWAPARSQEASQDADRSLALTAVSEGVTGRCLPRERVRQVCPHLSDVGGSQLHECDRCNDRGPTGAAQ